MPSAAANEQETQPVPGPMPEKSQTLPPSLSTAHQTSTEDNEISPATTCKSHASHVICCVYIYVCVGVGGEGERERDRERQREREREGGEGGEGENCTLLGLVVTLDVANCVHVYMYT